MSELCVRPVVTADRLLMERLWLMFRHDMSDYTRALPNEDGMFRSERLASAFGDPDWAGYLITWQDRPAGFALVRGLTGHTRVLNSFFVVRAARRSGIGLRAAAHVTSRHPGPWEVAFQDANQAAVAFWRRVATELAGTEWRQEHRPVPGRPDLPPDAWISFEVRA
jgi:predicted acetyltransferase